MRRTLPAAFLLCAAMLSPERGAATTLNAQGQVGQSSYTTFPFGSQVFTSNSWGCVNAIPGNSGLEIGNLYWQYGSFFTNSSYMLAAQAAAANSVQAGVVPGCTAQRWAETYMAAQPSDPPGEPTSLSSVVDSARANNGGTPLPDIPEYQAWVAWTEARSSLLDTAFDGGSYSLGMRPWGSTGWMSPDVPLPAADCPPDMNGVCTFGDWYAWKWAQTAALSGAYGFVGADYTNGLPADMSYVHDFNPLRIAGFSAYTGLSIPGSTVAEQSAYITSNYYPQWNDYCALGWAKAFNALQQRITAATGQQALVVAGGWGSPANMRPSCVDQRIMAQQSGLPTHLMVIYDVITMETDRSGDPMIEQIDGPVLAAAREPDIRNGAYLSANDSNYWNAVVQFYPTLTGGGTQTLSGVTVTGDQQEWGLKQLKREWLEMAWAHIADRTGQVRRAMPYAYRDHFDGGTVDPTVTKLIQTITPTKPFGIALYYSTAVERLIEPQYPPIGNLSAAPNSNGYMPPGTLVSAKQTMPLNYYVSDAAIPNLQANAKPAGWLVIGTNGLMKASEVAALTKIAPVYTTVAQAKAASPLQFTGGLTGTAFYDQNNRLIITVSNPSIAANAVQITGTMTLEGLPNGTYNMLDLFANTTTPFTVSGGKASMSMTVTRWDTLAFAITQTGA